MDKYKNKTINKRDYKSLLFITFFALFIISAIRYNVGKDYNDTYVFTYRLVLADASYIRADLGIIAIYKIMAFLKANVQWIFVITSFLVNYFVCKSIVTQSKKQFLSYWIYICGTFYFFSMNGVRQSIAIAIFYYSVQYIKEKKVKTYFLLNGVGCLFHASAVIFLPLYFILGRRFKTKTKLFVAIVVLVGGKLILPYIMNILLQTKYAIYLTNSAYSALDTINFSMILNIALFILFEWRIRKKSDENSIIYSNIHYAGLIVTLFATSIPLMIRIFVSFRYIEFLSVPHLVEVAGRKRYRKIIEFFIITIYFAYFVHGVLIKNGNTVLPYQTFLFK